MAACYLYPAVRAEIMILNKPVPQKSCGDNVSNLRQGMIDALIKTLNPVA